MKNKTIIHILSGLAMMTSVACSRDHLYYETVGREKVQLNIDWSKTAFSPESKGYDDDNRLNTYDREMLTLFFYSTSIVKTSRLMGINNITCRSHLNTVVNRLLSNGHVDMYNLFRYIMSNLNNIKKYVPRDEQP